jgi:hypothetical protein
LEQAAQDPRNAASAGVLLKLAEKMEKEAGPATKAGGNVGTAPAPAAKAEAPVSPTVGDMMSTASQAGTTEPTVAPTVPAENAPAVPAQETPLAPVERTLDMDQGSAGSAVAPAPEVEQTALRDDDRRGAGDVAQGAGGAAVEKAGFAGSAAAGVWPGLSRLIGSHAPNYRADIVVFVSILSLALAGVWIEWRFLGRRPV